MIADLKPYPAYKDSGVEWLGEVPEHWGVRRTKAVLRERSQKGFPDEPLLAATQTKGVVRKEQYENRTVLALKDLHLLKLVRVGDFVISLRSFQGGIEYAREQGIISPAYTILFADDPGNHGFLAHLFKSKPYIENLGLFVTGIRQGQNIDYEKLSRSRLPFPPLPEQAAIVRYLDYVDRRVRRLVRAKRKLIKLLEEQKQAIIHQAVTRGLNPDAPLKDSGVEWLGKIPAHWEILQGRALSRIVRGGTPRPAGDLRFFQGDAGPWITVGELTKDGGMYLSETSTRLTDAGVERSRTVLPGTLLLTNSGATLGVPKITAIQGCINDGVAAFLQVRADSDLSYLYFYWKTQTPHLLASVSLGAQPNLNTQIIGGWPVVVPPLSEQLAIAEHLAKATANIDTSLTHATQEISLLNEYRTRLIADVVTGKLDVREAAATLPEVDPLDAKNDQNDVLETSTETEPANVDAVPAEAEA